MKLFNNKKLIKYFSIFLFILIFLLGLILRITYLDSNFGLTYDEIFSYDIAKQNLIQLTKTLLTNDYHPPLYFILLHFWMKIFGKSDIVIQYLSVFISVFAIIPLYYIGKTLKNRALGLILILLYAFSQVMIAQSILARFYIIAMVFVLISLYFGLRITEESDIKNIRLFFIFSLFALYSQTSAIFIVLSSIIVLTLIQYYSKSVIYKIYLKNLFYFFLLYLPQLIFTLIQIFYSKNTLLNDPWAWSPKLNAFELFSNNIQKYFISKTVFTNDINIAILIFVFLVSYLIYFIVQKNKKGVFLFGTTILYGLLYLGSNYFKLIKLCDNNSYFMIISILMIICFIYSIFLLRKFLCLAFIIVISAFVINNNLNIYKKTISNNKNPNPNSLYCIANYITKSGYDNGIIYAPYGDKHFLKYIKNQETFGIDGDKLFTQKNWKTSAELIFDDDLEKMNPDEKYDYLYKYITNNTSKDNIKKLYNSKINSLKKGQHFTIIIKEDRFLSFSDINDVKHFLLLKTLAPHIVMGYLSAIIINSANLDKRLYFSEQNRIGSWMIFSYQRK